MTSCVAHGCTNKVQHSQLCRAHIMSRARGNDIPVTLELHGATPCRDNRAVFADETQWHIAKALCQVCPAIATCRQLALDTRQRFDVWGGMTPTERVEWLALTQSGRRPEYRRRFGGWAVPDAEQRPRHARADA